jgi:hypothetical protein
MRTADGVEIVDGLRVWTNDIETGTVDLVFRGGAQVEVNQNTGAEEWWFYVNLDKGSFKLMSESRVTTKWKGQQA